LLFLFTIIT